MTEITPGISDSGASDNWDELGGLADPDGSSVGHASFVDQCVWVASIILKERLNPQNTVTYYLSHEYWDEGELYAGSPVIYPLLAGEREDLIVEREVGREVAVLHETTLELYGKSDLADYGDSFYDLRHTYGFQDAKVELYCYFKPKNSLANSSTANLMQGNLKVRSASWEGDELSLLCKQVMFEEKEISKRLSLDDFPSMVEEFDQEYGSIAFGESVVVEAPFLITDTIEEGSIFLSFVTSNHELGAFNQLWAANRESPSDNQYVQIALDAGSTATHGNPAFFPYGDTDVNFGEAMSVVFSPLDNASKIAFAVTVPLHKVGTPTDDGYIRVYIARAPEYSIKDAWIEDRILREMRLDFTNVESVVNVMAYIYPPLVMTTNENYLIGAEWSNPDSTTDGFRFRYRATGTNSNDNAQSRDNVNRGTWGKQVGLDPIIALYSFQTGTPSFIAKTGTDVLVSRFDFTIQPQNETPAVSTPNSDGKIYYGLNLKADIDGLKDTLSGDYTGVAFSVIKRPADIIRFLLQDDELGRGLNSSEIDISSFESVRTSQASDNLELSFAIDRQTFLTEQILSILRQSRTIMYLKRDGKIAVRYPTYFSMEDEQISEGRWGSELIVESVLDTSDNDVVNDIEIPYGVNKLNPIEDRQRLRALGGTDAFESITSINEDSSSDSDTTRQAKAEKSINLYGRHSLREAFELHHADSTGVTLVRNYLFDRYSETQQEITIRVPLSEFYQLDLFDILKVAHTNIPAKYGTARRNRWHDTGDEVTWFQDGIPVIWESFGNSTGEIVKTTMSGEDIVLTMQTVSPY